MLSFASVARGEAGEDLGAFTINLVPLDGAAADPETARWWRSQPEAWAEATRDPVAPEQAISCFCAWVRDLPGRPVFVAHPLAFDGGWIDWYLRRFAGLRLFEGPWTRERLFHGTGIDLPSLVSGALGWDYLDCRLANYPAEWLGGHAHSHRALDDALGYAHLLVELRRGRLAGARPIQTNR